MTHASTRTRDRKTEARTGPRSSVPPQWQATTHCPGSLRRHLRLAPTKTPLTAGRPSDERVPGRGPRVCSAPVIACSLRHQRGVLSLWCRRVAPKSASAHQCPRMCLRAKDHLRTPCGGLPEPLRPTTRPVLQRSGLAVTEEWRLGRRRATRLPEEEQATQRQELSGRRCHATATSGLHQSWWNVGLRNGVGTAYTPCSLVLLHSPVTATPRWPLSSLPTRTSVRGCQVKSMRSSSPWRLLRWQKPRSCVVESLDRAPSPGRFSAQECPEKVA